MDKILKSVTIQMKATEQYVSTALFVLQQFTFFYEFLRLEFACSRD